MRVLAGVVVLAALTQGTAGAAAEGPPQGLGCGSEAIAVADPSTYRGVVYGGPVAAPGAVVTLRCSVHAGSFRHSDAAVVVESSAPSAGVAVLEPRPIAYPRTDDSIVVCTEATVGATTWFLSHGPSGAGWTTDPATECAGPFDGLYSSLPPPAQALAGAVLCLVFGDFCDVAGPVFGVLHDEVFAPYADPALCPVLAGLAPGEPGVVDIDPAGDTYVTGSFVWDCPPYAG